MTVGLGAYACILAGLTGLADAMVAYIVGMSLMALLALWSFLSLIIRKFF